MIIGILVSGPFLSMIVRLSPHPDKRRWFLNPGNSAIYTILPVLMVGGKRRWFLSLGNSAIYTTLPVPMVGGKRRWCSSSGNVFLYSTQNGFNADVAQEASSLFDYCKQKISIVKE